MDKHSHFKSPPILVLVALCSFGSNAENNTPAKVVPLAVPTVSYASNAGPNLVCGLGYSPLSRGSLSASIQLMNLANNQVTTLLAENAEWNPNREVLAGAVCSRGQTWFITTERNNSKKSVWKIGDDGIPVPFLRPGDLFCGYTYVDDIRLISNSSRVVLLGKFSSPNGTRILALTPAGQLVADYGDRSTVFEACVTDESLVATVRFIGPFGAENLVTRTRNGIIWGLESISDLGNDGTTDTSLLNLTHTVGCSDSTAGFIVRNGTLATAWTIRDTELAPTRIFSGSTTGKYPITNFWGLTIDATDNVSFAMSVSVPAVFGQQAIFRFSNGEAKAIATEGIDFPRISATAIVPLAVGSRLVFFQTPIGGGYEIK